MVAVTFFATGHQGRNTEMRRDYFDANVRNDDEQDVPTLVITFDGPAGLLADRLVTNDGTLDASEIDVTYRLKMTPDGEDAGGVLSIADRLTGEFLLEANVDPDGVKSLVRTAKRTDGDDETRYRVRLTDSDGKSTVYDKETFLVYDAEGSLLRQQSLIPGGVEL